MQVTLKIMVMDGTRMVNQSCSAEVAAGLTLEKFFRQVDEEKRFGRKYLAKLLADRRPPVVLLNGNRVEVPEELGKSLADGDEVSVVSPIAGG